LEISSIQKKIEVLKKQHQGGKALQEIELKRNDKRLREIEEVTI